MMPWKKYLQHLRLKRYAGILTLLNDGECTFFITQCRVDYFGVGWQSLSLRYVLVKIGGGVQSFRS